MWCRIRDSSARTLPASMFSPCTEHGELHWPKDNHRREIRVSAEEEALLRSELLVDVQELANQGEQLSPGWWRQLGDESKAQAGSRGDAGAASSSTLQGEDEVEEGREEMEQDSAILEGVIRGGEDRGGEEVAHAQQVADMR
ncbi:hypothetical protein AB1Y20_009957 [Prymnesium parvum]|uniref:Uncharacterized protein n=1 Tax=Prymnesium parvum TaxID=97485 RepID=A0AB34K3I7_PRYPA